MPPGKLPSDLETWAGNSAGPFRFVLKDENGDPYPVAPDDVFICYIGPSKDEHIHRFVTGDDANFIIEDAPGGVLALSLTVPHTRALANGSNKIEIEQYFDADDQESLIYGVIKNTVYINDDTGP